MKQVYSRPAPRAVFFPARFTLIFLSIFTLLHFPVNGFNASQFFQTSQVRDGAEYPNVGYYIQEQQQQQQYSAEWGTGFCDEQCTCGLPNRSSARTVGGKPTLVNEYPWVAALLEHGEIFCGATVITDRHVLTAAHCVKGSISLLRNTTVVVLAEHDTTLTDESPTETRRIASVTRHPDYRNKLDGDLALIRMSRPLTFSAQLSPACLPSPGEDYVGFTGTVAGWGRTTETGNRSHELQAVDVPILNQEDCRYFHDAGVVNNRMMCAGRLEGGADACKGDSGGALVVTEKTYGMNRMVIVGIVSWGVGCGRPYKPGVYTRVNKFLGWIQSNTRDACFCG